MQETLDKLWASNQNTISGEWRNAKTGNYGTINLTNRRTIDNVLCYDSQMTINIKSSRRDKKTKVNTLCRATQGSYKLK